MSRGAGPRRGRDQSACTAAVGAGVDRDVLVDRLEASEDSTLEDVFLSVTTEAAE